jgi:hypothetical protein
MRVPEVGGVADFRSVRLRGRLACRWISFNIALLAIALALTIWHFTLLLGGPGMAPYEVSLARVATAGVAELVIYAIGAAAFLYWFRGACANLRALGGGRLRYGTGQVVGFWFVPVLCFWRPKQIADQLWIASDPDLVGRPKDAQPRRRVPAFIHAWWVLWVAGVVAALVYSQLPAGSLEQERAAIAVLAGAEAAQLAAGFLAIAFISRLTRRQEERARRLRAFARCMPCATAATTAR